MFMYTDTVDSSLVTVTGPAVVTLVTFGAVVRKHVFHAVSQAVELTTADTVKMSLSRATHLSSQTVCSSKKTVI